MSNGGGGAWTFTPHPVVAALVANPAVVPQLTIFAGLPGDGATDARKRVYVSPVLDEFLEVDTADLLFTYEWPGDIRHLVWIKEGARVTHISLREHDAGAGFLEGPITTAFYADAAAAAPQAAQPPQGAAPPAAYPYAYRWPTQPGAFGDWTNSRCKTCPSTSP
jgi:hypothetical protein